MLKDLFLEEILRFEVSATHENVIHRLCRYQTILHVFSLEEFMIDNCACFNALSWINFEALVENVYQVW